MADEIDTTFESAEAGASLTIPASAGSIRKNDLLMMKGKPCKVISVSVSKTGKHGHAKCNFTGLDIFTGKKLEDMQPSSHNVEVPNVARKEYTVIDITDEGFLGLMDESDNMREDIQLPDQTDADKDLANKIQAEFEAGTEFFVTVLAAMGIEKVISMKTVAGSGDE